MGSASGSTILHALAISSKKKNSAEAALYLKNGVLNEKHPTFCGPRRKKKIGKAPVELAQGKVLMQAGYQFKLRPTEAHQKAFSVHAGHRRYVWNRFLQANYGLLAEGKPILGYADMTDALTAMRGLPDTAWLGEAHSQVLQQCLKDLARAFKDGFDKQFAKKMPTSKKKGVDDSFRFPQGVKVDGRRVYLPGIGWVRMFKSQEIPGKICNATVTKRAGDWYVSLQVEWQVEKPVHPATGMVGIDLGVASFAATSEGKLHRPLNAFKKHEERLAKLQRRSARMKKFSQNWQRQQEKIRQCHHKMARCRRDYLHKLSTIISKNHAMIVLEDLKIQNMTASAAGTVEAPGKQVAQKSGLNKRILDQGWGMFGSMLEYKQQWRGGDVLCVPPQYTSQTCSVCGKKHPDSRKTQASFKCVFCGHQENADVNASKVILAAGQALLSGASSGKSSIAASACQAKAVAPRQQEPATTRNATAHA